MIPILILTHLIAVLAGMLIFKGIQKSSRYRVDISVNGKGLYRYTRNRSPKPRG